MWRFVHGIALLGLALPLCCGEIENYCNLCEHIGKVHTLCKYPKEGPGPLCENYKGDPFTPEEKAEILIIHNELRNKVAKGEEKRGYPGPQPSASNMRQMSWDSELEKIAQRWADQCVPYYGKEQYDECRYTYRDLFVAQNVGATRTVIGSKDVIPLITSWYDAVKNFNSNLINAFTTAVYPPNVNASHYVHIIWNTVHRLGCSRVIFDEDNGIRIFKVVRIVCNYGPTTRSLLMNNPYKLGVPCSQCPEGTSCSSIFDALCATREQIKEYYFITEPEETTLGPLFPKKHWDEQKTWQERYEIRTNKRFKMNLNFLTNFTTNATNSKLSFCKLRNKYSPLITPSPRIPKSLKELFLSTTLLSLNSESPKEYTLPTTLSSNLQSIEYFFSSTPPPGIDSMGNRIIVSENIVDSTDGPTRISIEVEKEEMKNKKTEIKKNWIWE